MRRNDDAVSPVIAVILMVAITVVLAATVYAWVASMSRDQGEVAGTLALASAGGDPDGDRYYVVTSATGVTWDGVTVLVGGSAPEYGSDAGEWCAMREDACLPDEGAGEEIRAGDVLALSAATEGEMLRVIDAEANALLIELVIR